LLKDQNFIILLIKNKLRLADELQIQISIVRIPAHSGILGNETVDLLAKNSIISGTHFDSLIPHTDFYAILKENLQKNHQESFLLQANSKGKNYFHYFRNSSLKPWFKNIKSDRQVIVTISRIRSNHYHLNSSLYRCNLVHSFVCDCGYPNQDINHIMWECPIFFSHRSALHSALQNNNNTTNPSNDIFELLQNPTLKNILLIFSFLNKNKLII